MITQTAYEIARKEIKTFADAGPNDTQMTLEMAKTLLAIRFSTTTTEVEAMSLAICAAIIYRYEEQNNLHADSPTNQSTVTT